MKKVLKLLLALLFIGFSYQISLAQYKTFDAGIIAGLNFAELEGNEVTDYVGINIGLLGTARFSKHGQIAIEFLFSQNGEYILPEFYPQQIEYGKIRLNHIEIPIHIDLLLGIFQREKFYDWNLNLGIAYSRILGYYAEDLNKQDVTAHIHYKNKEAYLLQAGTTYHFTKNIGLNLKASLPIRVEHLSWTLAARLIYKIG